MQDRTLTPHGSHPLLELLSPHCCPSPPPSLARSLMLKSPRGSPETASEPVCSENLAFIRSNSLQLVPIIESLRGSSCWTGCCRVVCVCRTATVVTRLARLMSYKVGPLIVLPTGWATAHGLPHPNIRRITPTLFVLIRLPWMQTTLALCRLQLHLSLHHHRWTLVTTSRSDQPR